MNASAAQYWCPNCRELLPDGIAARGCACGAVFTRGSAWGPKDQNGHVVLAPRPAGNSHPRRDWRVNWSKPRGLTPVYFRVAGWFALAVGAAGLVWLAYLILSGLFQFEGRLNGRMEILLAPVMWIMYGQCRKLERRSAASREFGKIAVTLHREMNEPFTLVGQVHFEPPLTQAQREMHWEVLMAVNAVKDVATYELMGSARDNLKIGADASTCEFRLSKTLPNQMPHDKIELHISLMRAGRSLYGMPLKFPAEIVLEIDTPPQEAAGAINS
jgi:hypothetical protein